MTVIGTRPLRTAHCRSPPLPDIAEAQVPFFTRNERMDGLLPTCALLAVLLVDAEPVGLGLA